MKRFIIVLTSGLMTLAPLLGVAQSSGEESRPGYAPPVPRDYAPPIPRYPTDRGIRVERGLDDTNYFLRIYTGDQDPSSVDVRIEGRTILISSADTAESEERVDEGPYGRRSFSFSRRSSGFNRHFTLPRDADIENLQQTEDNGVITIVVPRRSDFGMPMGRPDYPRGGYPGGAAYMTPYGGDYGAYPVPGYGTDGGTQMPQGGGYAPGYGRPFESESGMPPESAYGSGYGAAPFPDQGPAPGYGQPFDPGSGLPPQPGYGGGYYTAPTPEQIPAPGYGQPLGPGGGMTPQPGYGGGRPMPPTPDQGAIPGSGSLYGPSGGQAPGYAPGPASGLDRDFRSGAGSLYPPGQDSVHGTVPQTGTPPAGAAYPTPYGSAYAPGSEVTTSETGHNEPEAAREGD